MTAVHIAVFLLMLSVLVVLHEYGHFIVARLNGVRVTDFAMGMGPTLLKWTSPRSGTNYRLNLLPVGGYCQMKGEDGQSTEAEQQRQFRKTAVDYEADNFQAKTPLRRLAIVVAGPIANFIVALVLLFGVALASGIPSRLPSLEIGQLIKNGPADQAGLRPGDRIVTVDGLAMQNGDQLIKLIHGSTGKRLHLEYRRGNALRAVDVVPKDATNQEGAHEGRVGFSPVYPLAERWNIASSASAAWTQFNTTIAATMGVLGTLVTHPGAVAGQVQGPIGIARTSMAVQALGIGPFVSLAALLSISLGIFNLLPIPALDGGRGVFILVEMLRGRPVDPEKEALVHVGGFAVLIALMLAVSYHDIAAAVAGKSVF